MSYLLYRVASQNQLFLKNNPMNPEMFLKISQMHCHEHKKKALKEDEDGF
jgi:hypothetical protein